MQTRFILRFDDICPTMNWRVWRLLERDLYELNIKPLMAVIPDNRDRNLIVSAPGVDDFWNSVRSWQERGWTIGLHGYQHRYLTNATGMYGRMPRSEFAGLPYEIQEIKLRNAIRIFREQQVSGAFLRCHNRRHSFKAGRANHQRRLCDLSLSGCGGGYLDSPAVWEVSQTALRRLDDLLPFQLMDGRRNGPLPAGPAKVPPALHSRR
jgi:hypothetical protein